MPPSRYRPKFLDRSVHGRLPSQADIPLLTVQSKDVLTPPATAEIVSRTSTPPPRVGSFSDDGIPLHRSQFDLNSWGLFLLTFLACIITFTFAYNSTRTNPDTKLIFAATRMVLILNVLSTASAFLISELVQTVFERTRWILASRAKGIMLTEFLGMSRATSILGILALLWWNPSNQNPRVSRIGGRQWILQRLGMFVVFSALRQVLFRT